MRESELFDILPNGIITELKNTPVISFILPSSEIISGSALCSVLRERGLKVLNELLIEEDDTRLRITVSNEPSS